MRTEIKMSALMTPVLLLLVSPAFAQFEGPCSKGEKRELQESIQAHNENIYRLNYKFKNVWYFAGPVPQEVTREVSLEDVHAYLTKLEPRKTGVLFHAKQGNKFCTWLVDYKGGVTFDIQQDITGSHGKLVIPSEWQALGVRGATHLRADPQAEPGPQELSKNRPTIEEWDSVLRPITQLLFPDPILKKFLALEIDTLIVVPITVATGENLHNNKLDETKDFTLTVSAVPFGALPVSAEKRLIDVASVIVAPGFFIFAQDPGPTRQTFLKPLVVGDPGTGALSLPGARKEAIDVARIFGVQALTSKDATKAKVLSTLRKHAKRIDVIHFATHGLANNVDPLDESLLVFSDDELTAREIGHLRIPASFQKGPGKDQPLLAKHPLVVMSACQTGKGKDFSVGTIGLARAWQWAGAAQVVVTLWSVDDTATQRLMTQFMKLVAGKDPVDKALQKAMQQFRGDDSNPASWASFQLFGSPELLHEN